jgi:peptide/nickel transport system permease protein
MSAVSFRLLARPRHRTFSPNAVLVSLALVYLLVLLVIVIDPGVIGNSPTAFDISDRLHAPTIHHLFGTDELGRDLFARVVYGARNSVGVAVVVVVIAVAVGLLVGTVAGWFGGWVDSLLMRIVDIFLAFPAFVLALALAAALGAGLKSVIIALSAVWWPAYARLVRGAVLSLKNAEHVEAAAALGLSRTRIIWRHVLRFVWRDLNIRATADVGYALMAVTALSFLGLGAQPPTAEWGLLIQSSASYFYVAWWYMAFPGLAVTFTAVAFSILGDWFASRGGGGRTP